MARRRTSGGILTRAALTRAALTQGSAKALAQQWAFGSAFPLSLQWAGFWRANYAASPWLGIATDGNTLGRNLTEATNPPTTGAAQNGYTPALFDGTNDLLTADLTATDYVGAKSVTIHAVVWIDTAPAPTAFTFDNPCIVVAQFSGIIGLGVATNGVRFGVYTTGPYVETAAVACSTGAWHRVQARYNGANVSVRVDGGAWTNAAATDPFAAGASPLLVGTDIVGTTAFLDGRILELGISAAALSDAECDALDAYSVARYGLGSSTAAVAPSAWGAPASWPSPTVTNRFPVAPTAWSAPALWPSATLNNRVAVTSTSWAAPASWPSPTVVARYVVGPSAWNAPASWPSPTLALAVVTAPASWSAPASWPSPVVTTRAAVAPFAWNAPASWPSPTVRTRAAVSPAAWPAPADWPTPSLTTRLLVSAPTWSASAVWLTPTITSIFPVSPVLGPTIRGRVVAPIAVAGGVVRPTALRGRVDAPLALSGGVVRPGALRGRVTSVSPSIGGIPR